MKKIKTVTLTFVAAAVLVLLIGVFVIEMKTSNSDKSPQIISPNTKHYSYLDNIDMSKVERKASQMLLDYDPQIPKSIESISSNIFIAKVISLDKADTPYDKDGMGKIFPFTFGKLEVLTNISGEMSETEVEFVRPGGVMKEKDIYRYDYPTDLEEIDAARVAAGNSKVEDSETLIDTRYEDDFYLEAGKVYLMYAKRHEDWQKYEITGFQYGSLELLDNDQSIDAMPESRSNPSGKMISKSWKVKNVSTGEEQNLDDYLKDGLGINISSQ